MMFPIKLISSLLKAKSIVKRFQPHVAIGTGGFASGPLLKMAAMAKVPYVLQEQNSIAGITNKLLAPKADKICVAYDGMHRFFPKDKVVKTGNPIRSDLVNLSIKQEEAKAHFGFNKNKPVLLILGGSLGARRINQLIENKLPFFAGLGLQVLWQCGKLYFEDYKKLGTEQFRVKAFLNEMDYAYAAADFVISRAGAGSVSELCLIGKPTVFIPSPNVAEDHQTKNAEALVHEDAAIMICEYDLEKQFEQRFKMLFDSKERQKQLSSNIRRLALPKATAHIVDEIEKLLNRVSEEKNRKKE